MEDPDVKAISPVRASKIVKPRDPPSKSPSSAVAKYLFPIKVTPSGSRGTSFREADMWMRSSSSMSMLMRSTVPAVKLLETVLVARSMRRMALFSWSVTTAMFFLLMATNSGSGSWGYRTPGRPVKEMTEDVQSLTSGAVSTSTTKPAGICGGTPSPRSSSRSFSIATRIYLPSGLTATESGWPPSCHVLTITLVAISMATSSPEVLTKSSLVFTAAKAKPPRTATEVGSPESATVPKAAGLAGSLISTKPIFSCSESVYTSVIPSSVAVTISATVSVSVLHVASSCLQMANVAIRLKFMSSHSTAPFLPFLPFLPRFPPLPPLLLLSFAPFKPRALPLNSSTPIDTASTVLSRER
mmetsp:Transcript_47959/g.72548  ORF Transcript_47959/g.72548 Transcript_47959/m.72548 type:complete len:356 (+) Transcript_47959:1473-2540(+)